MTAGVLKHETLQIKIVGAPSSSEASEKIAEECKTVETQNHLQGIVECRTRECQSLLGIKKDEGTI